MSSIVRMGTLFITLLLLAGLAHVSTILLIPTLAPVDDWSRLAPLSPLGKFTLLPAGTPSIPRSDPMTILALCRYDLDGNGQIEISGTMNLPYWGLSAHNRLGLSYYTINNRTYGEKPLSLRIMSPEDLVRFRADLPEDAEQQLLIASTGARGFVLVRALVLSPSARDRVEGELQKLSCQAGG